MMKIISVGAELSQIYTNHSVRASAITLLSDPNVPDRHIMFVSGHSNEQSLAHYSSRPSVTQLESVSDTISNAVENNQPQTTEISTFTKAPTKCRPTRTKSPDLSELLRSLIISRAFPPISSIVLPVPYAKKYTSVKRPADWVIVSANTLGMLRLTIKTLLNQSRHISTSLTILKNTWRFVVFPSI